MHAQGIELAAGIIASHFGEVAQSIARLYLNNEALQLSDIEVELERQYSSVTIKEALVVLIQHNCMNAVTIRKGKSTKTVYELNAPLTISRLHVPAMMNHIRASMGLEHMSVAMCLFQHGCLSSSRLQKIYVEQHPETPIARPNDVLMQLIAQGYVRSAKTMIQAKPAETETTTGKRRASKAGLSSPTTKRLKSNQGNARNISASSSGCVETDSPGSPSDNQDNVQAGRGMLRIETRAFEFEMRLNQCASMVASRHAPWTGWVLRVMCQKIKESVANGRNGTDTVEWLRPEDIHTRLQQLARIDSQCPAINLADLKAQLIAMAAEIEEYQVISSQVSAHGTSFGASVKLLDAWSIRQTIEKMVKDKWGHEARRLFRIIRQKQMMETKSAWDYGMVPPKTARSLLFQMFQQGYVQMQEISRAEMSDKGLHLWSVDELSIRVLVAKEMQRTTKKFVVCERGSRQIQARFYWQGSY